jgi:site-specific DNA-methyltransferase (adenine-specific)
MKPYYEDAAAGITIYHADCREVLPSLPKVDLVLTDPPYSHQHMDGGGLASARPFYAGGALKGLNDFKLPEYWQLIHAAAPMLVAFCSRDLVSEYCAAATGCGRKLDLHFWHKTNAIPFTANTWKSDVEYIVLAWDRKPGWTQCEQSAHSKVWISPINQDHLHPAAKPIPLLMKYIRVLNAQAILDPFMGSGTTLVAAKRLGRRAIGIEIEEKYCAIAAERLERERLTLFGHAGIEQDVLPWDEPGPQHSTEKENSAWKV